MNNPSKVESILLAALDKATPEARSAFLDDVCQDNPGLREQVNRLLSAHPKAVEFLEEPVAQIGEKTAVYAPTDEQSGGIIAGRYKLLEKIGEGGMGQVWVADQLEPIKRRVALKLIKPGMDSRSVLGRFEAERQALAVMDHPNIAKVLDAGATADGRPYFVMELVKGTPITEFCDARRLTPPQRLELFVPVCQAIQHAHMKGIIHRDIKPSNVLVALYDETPVAKVIDFGVAKAVGQQFTEKTIYTGFGALVGTPAYMAPEQATFNQLDVDTRADVYALGVLLYELLAGSPPIEKDRLKLAALDEVLRIVRDEEPPRPSQRLTTSQAKASIAATRQSDPAKLSALMKGEIDWIVMKALEKDRTRRYDTANGLANDIQRYLAGDAVEACPPTLGYRLRKAYRKNRAAVRVAGAFALLLLAAVAVSSWLAMKASRAEAVAENNADSFYEAIVTADKALQQVEQTSASQKVDADLVETDPRVSLLRLARTLSSFPEAQLHRRYPLKTGGEIALQASPDFLAAQQALREFLTAAILIAGQDFAPLLTPITHDGHAILTHHLNSDGESLLTLGADGTARLWDTRTGKMITILRQENEHVETCGISPDGNTIFTYADSNDVRLWEGDTGAFRVRIGSNSLSEKDTETVRTVRSAQILDDRILLQRIVRVKQVTDRLKSAVELWNTKTGRLVCRLDRPDLEIGSFKLLPSSQWVVAIGIEGGGDTTGYIFSAEDGREIARLTHSENEKVEWIGGVSPSGLRMATWAGTVDRKSLTEVREHVIHFWDTTSWKEISTIKHAGEGQFLSDDVYATKFNGDLGEESWNLIRIGQADKSAFANAEGGKVFQVGSLVYTGNGKLFDIDADRRLLVPAGRRFHPSLAKFAPDGRYVVAETITGWGTLGWEIIDTKTEKTLGLIKYFIEDMDQIPHPRSNCFGHRSGFGTVLAEQIASSTLKCRVVPISEFLPIPPALLQLWAQVAVRGELDPAGEFFPWNEQAWEKKQQELAAFLPPNPEFPFPGFLATDKLHWLRAEFQAASGNSELKWRLAEELHRRAEEAGNLVEASRWRAWLTR